MPATTRTIRHVFKPTGVGKGGQFTNTNSQEADPTSMVDVFNFYVDGGRWQGRNATAGSIYSSTTQFVVVSRVINDFIGVIDSAGATTIVSQSGGTLFGPVTGNPYGIFETVRTRVYISAGNGGTSIVPKLYDPAIGLTTWGQAGQSLSSQLTYNIGTSVYAAGTITVTTGASTCTGTGGGFTAAMVGHVIYILGGRYIVSSFTNGTTITISPNYIPAGGVQVIPNGSWAIYLAYLSWTAGNGLRYAVSYYNTNTGHTSNLSSIVSIDDGNPFNDNETITIGNILHSSLAYGAGYQAIIVWRSTHGGGVVFPRAIIPNANDNLATTYIDGDLVNDSHEIAPLLPPASANSDTILGTVIGQFGGTQTNNTPPPADLQFGTYWDGRMWGWSVTKQAILYSSSISDMLSQSLVGVAEECFPPTNFVPLPESEYTVTGMRVSANTLMVSGGYGIYSVYTNTSGLYSLTNISSKGAGSSQYSMDRLPGEDASSSDILIHIGNDRRLYFLYGPGGDVSYSYPIQDFPALGAGSNIVSAKVIHGLQSTYIYYMTGAIFQTTLVYDVERKIWFRHSLGAYSTYSEVKDNTLKYMRPIGTTKIGANYTLQFQDMIGNSSGTPDPNGYDLISQTFAPPGAPRNAVKTLQEIHVFTVFNNTDVPAVVVFSTFGNTNSNVTLTQVTTTADTLNRSFEAGELIFVPPTGTIIQGNTFEISLNWFTPSHPPDVSMIEAVFSLPIEDASVDGTE